jgi:glycosyltransferase involved in cell wall biosynthesis
MANQTRQLKTLLESEGAVIELVQVNAPYRPAWVGRLPMVRAAVRLLGYLPHLWQAAGRTDVFHVMANSGWSWHLFATPAVWIARMRGTATVVNYRGGEAEAFFLRSIHWVRPTMRQAHVIVPSGFLRDVFARFGMEAHVVPNVVDLARFSPSWQPGRPLHILVARNLEPLYDIPSALAAFRRVRETEPNARMTIAGSGPQRAELEKLAHKLGVAEATVFAGRVDNAAMGALYAAATVTLNPSIADNTPNSVLESLACGVPVVSTNVGGVPYLVQHGVTALLVPPRDSEAMAEAILGLHRNAERAASLSAAGLRHVQQFAWAKVRPQLESTYRQALHARARRAASKP